MVALNQQYVNIGHMCHNEGKGKVIFVYVMGGGLLLFLWQMVWAG